MVAFGGLADPPFSLLHQTDAADAVLAAIAGGPDAPVNVVGDGATTPAQAARIGGRVALPIVGPQWQLARIGAELFGAPLPDHVKELLTRGRLADGAAAADLLGFAPAWSTGAVVRDLYEWAPVTHVRPGQEVIP